MNTVSPFPTELNNSIVGAARKVLTLLKPGLDERAYERALIIELRKRGFRLEQQKLFEIYYEGELIDLFVASLIVDGHTVVCCRVLEEFTPSVLAQAEGALSVTKLPEVLLLNFQRVELSWERIEPRPTVFIPKY